MSPSVTTSVAALRGSREPIVSSTPRILAALMVMARRAA
jgi:hypothetical protein